MAPPWVKGPREPSSVGISNSAPWAKGPLPVRPSGYQSQDQSAHTTASNLPQNVPNFSQMSTESISNVGAQKESIRTYTSQKSTESPKSLGALLQQLPLPAATPSCSESISTPLASSASPKPKQGLRGPLPPIAAGPLAGAKFVLPPIPPRPTTKATSGKTAAQLAKIAALRHSVRPRPEDIGDLLREIEEGTKLNHVTCDDRSKPLIRRCQTFFPEF